MLDLRGRLVLVVGGGAVARRRVGGLLLAGARPTIVAPAVDAELLTLARAEGLTVHARPYRSGDVAGHDLVFAATNRRDVNERVLREAAAERVLANAADEPAASAFQLPAVLRQGEVTVALSTGGAAPLLARRLRERLEAVVTPGLGRTAARLSRLREQLHRHAPDEARRRRFWFALITPEFLESAIAGQDNDVENRIARCLLKL